MAGDVKLTKAQASMLRRLDAGLRLVMFTGRRAHASFVDDFRGRAPSVATVEALRKRMLIEAGKAGIGSRDYTITDAGRAALRKET